MEDIQHLIILLIHQIILIGSFHEYFLVESIRTLTNLLRIFRAF